jgi:hypothetical protein
MSIRCMVVWLLLLADAARLGTGDVRADDDDGESSLLNVRGAPLEPCSATGMAQTGFSRDRLLS